MLTFAEIISAADAVPGWMTVPELRWLASTAAALPCPATWLEVGAWCGRSTLAVGLALPKGSTLHVVDSFADHYQETFRREKLGDWLAKRKFGETMANLMDARPDLRINVHVTPSAEAEKFIAARSCDVAFIDADHSLKAVLDDCGVTSRLLKPGGLQCGHDYSEDTNHEVAQAVDHLYAGRFAVAAGTTIWSVRL